MVPFGYTSRLGPRIIAARLRLSKHSIIIELKIGNYLYFCRFLVILAFKGRLCALNLLNVMNTFGANLLNVMNTRETMMPLIFVVKLYKKGCSVITILKTFCIQKIKKTPCFMLMRRGVLVFRADHLTSKKISISKLFFLFFF